ncbi:hypothetical protein DITRI_Ditri14bG0082500 [Diplodiscus trichospermus]
MLARVGLGPPEPTAGAYRPLLASIWQRERCNVASPICQINTGKDRFGSRFGTRRFLLGYLG